MPQKLTQLINKIGTAISKKKKVLKTEPLQELKIFTFFVKGEGVRKSVNVKAVDKASAEEKIHAKFPDCTTDFLWELIRSPR